MFARLGLRFNNASTRRIMTQQFREYKINADEIKAGFLLEHEGKKMSVISYKAAMMGRRPTSLHIEMRDTVSGKVYPFRFNPSDRVERIIVDHTPYNFLYAEGKVAYAMHPETFEQLEFDTGILGDRVHYLQPDTSIDIAFYQGNIFSITTPDTAIMEVVDAPYSDPNTNNNEFKPCKLSNGRIVKCPHFINNGDKVKVRIADEGFMTRE